MILALAASPSLVATALVVTPLTPASSLGVPYDYTGNGKGFAMGMFDIANPHSAGLVLHSITLTATGSGDDSAAYSEFGLFLDINQNSTFEHDVDQRYGQVYSAYPADDGNLTFTESLAFAAGESKRFIVVAKLGGATAPLRQHGFLTIVESIAGTGAAPVGVPTVFFRGINIINYHTPLRLEYDVTGSVPPYAYTFRVVLDNHDGSWISGQDWSTLLFGMSSYGAPSGTAPFASWITNAASFPVGPFTSTSSGVSTVAGIAYYCAGLVDNVAPIGEDWVPAAVGDALVWWGTADTFLDEGQMAWSFHRVGGPSVPGSANLEPAYRVGDYIRVVAVPAAVARPGPLETGSGDGFLLGAFDVIAHSNAATFSGLTLAALGTGDDASAFSEIRLYVDSNGNGAFDPGVDTPFGATYTAFGADNGSLTFNDTLNLAVNETKRLLVVCKLNGATPASFGQTFQARIMAINATGQNHSGLPTAAVSGLRIHAPAITVTSTGMNVSAFANGVGPGAFGLSVAEFLLSNNAVGTANLGSITVAAAGSLFDHTAFSFAALYEDSNGNGTFDAADTLYGTAAGAFASDDGNLTFTGPMTFAPGQSRRLFLVVKLNGTATIGDDFWTRIAALGVTGGTEAPTLGTLEQAFTIIPGSDPSAGGGSGGGDDGDSGGCSTDERALSWYAALLGILCALAAGLRLSRRVR